MSSPHPDLPFEPDQVAHIVRRLRVLGIPVDRAWLNAESAPYDAIILEGHAMQLSHARTCIPKSNAHWELSEFFRYTIAAAVFDCQWLTNYEAFEFLYVRILGEISRPWLPSLYLAAATAPSLVESSRVMAVANFNVDVLRENRS